VGTVYIAAELTETGQRARQYLVIAGGILLICMAAGLLISSTARRLVARPMVALAETARRVSRERDYSVRAAPHPDKDEIAVLIEAFNEDAGADPERDTALNRGREQLESAGAGAHRGAAGGESGSWRPSPTRWRTICGGRSMRWRGWSTFSRGWNPRAAGGRAAGDPGTAAAGHPQHGGADSMTCCICRRRVRRR